MAGPDLPEIPGPLRGIQHYLKIASEHDQRDPVVSYWARLYSLQTGLKISTKTPAENNFLLKLMDWLETTKKSMSDNEAVTNEVAAQAHLENWALKLFLYADKNDREGIFNKRVIQSFYTAGLLYDVLTTFGELTEEAVQNRKYAKWKAAYIHNCLKNGETPVPGPMKDTEDDEDDSNLNIGPGPEKDLLLDLEGGDEPTECDNGKEEEEEPEKEPEGESVDPEQAEEEPSEPGTDPASVDEDTEAPQQPTPPSNNDAYGFPLIPGSTPPKIPGDTPYPSLPTPMNPNPYNPAPTPTSPSVPTDLSTTPAEGVALNAEQMLKAAKYIKWAGSAINYDDVSATIENLRKALHLLTTGEDS